MADEFPVPRPFQESAVNKAVAYLNQGKSPLIISPTGSGKTLIFSLVVQRWNPLGRTLILAPTKETCNQATRYRWLAERGGRDQWDAQVIVTTPQGAYNNLQTILKHGKVRLIVSDEAHGAAAFQYGYVIAALKMQGALNCGVTATPDRLDGQHLNDGFDVTITATTMEDAIARGDVAEPNMKVYSRSDGTSVIGAPDEIAQVCYAWWQETKGNMPTILFTPTVAKAQEYAAYLNRYGIAAAVVHGSMPDKQRKATLAAYSAGRIRLIANADALTVGADLPTTRCVVLAKGTNSRTKFSQATGRGTRPVTDGGENKMLLLNFDYRPSHNLRPDHDGLGQRPPSKRDEKKEKEWQRVKGMTPKEYWQDRIEQIRSKRNILDLIDI